MSFSLWILGLIPVLGGMVAIGKVAADLYERESVEIAQDNYAILIGRADRKLLNWMEAQNLDLKRLHSRHHPLHLCAQNPEPKTSAACKVLDRAVELQMRKVYLELKLKASVDWIRNKNSAKHEMQRWGFKIKDNRPLLPPFKTFGCGQCAFPLKHELFRPLSFWVASDLSFVEKVHVNLDRHQNAWQYQIQ